MIFLESTNDVLSGTVIRWMFLSHGYISVEDIIDIFFVEINFHRFLSNFFDILGGILSVHYVSFIYILFNYIRSCGATSGLARVSRCIPVLFTFATELSSMTRFTANRTNNRGTLRGTMVFDIFDSLSQAVSWEINDMIIHH